MADIVSVNDDGKTLSVILVYLSIFFASVWFIRRHRMRNLPPGPVNPLVIYAARKNPYLHFTRFSKKYGNIFSFRFGTGLTVVLNNADVIKDALVQQADTFSYRFNGKAVMILIDGDRGSILNGNGQPWREMRRFASQALRSFGVGKRSLGNKINEESQYLIEAIINQDGKPFDPTHIINNAVSNIICSICFGDRYDYEDPKFQNLLGVLRSLTKTTNAASLLHIFPYLVYVPPYRKRLDAFAVLKEFIRGIVDEHRASLNPNDVRDIIDMYLLEIDQQGVRGHDELYDVKRTWKTIFELFAAGSDTTSNSLMWTLAIFCHYPDVQKKVYEEINNVIGTERFPLFEDRLRLPYTEAVILEIQRFRPVVPLVPHTNIRNATVGGYHIPKHSRIFINIWATEHDPKMWKDPESFIPERFLSPDGNSVIQNEAHMPFGVGRRICLGETLANMEVFLFLASLVQRFHFCVPEGCELPSLDGIQGITLSIPSYDICAHCRN